MLFVGREVLERPPIRTGIECHDREAVFGKLAGERAAAGAGADDRKVNRFLVGMLAHRHPAAGMKHVGCAAANGAGGIFSVYRHARSPAAPALRARAWLRRLPTDRAGCNSSAHSRADWPGRHSRSRSKRSDANSKD